MLELGRAAAVREGLNERVHFVQGSATDLPFDAGEFDVSISHFMLHHIDAPRELFDEMARATRGGGRVLIKDLLRQPRWKAAGLMAFSKLVLGYSEAQLRMYRESMDSALSVTEVRKELRGSRLSMATVRGFRGLDFVIAA
jgi:ubiquinone/menaquinone biosynthesis C-methylase UbiE